MLRKIDSENRKIIVFFLKDKWKKMYVLCTKQQFLFCYCKIASCTHKFLFTAYVAFFEDNREEK